MLQHRRLLRLTLPAQAGLIGTHPASAAGRCGRIACPGRSTGSAPNPCWPAPGSPPPLFRRRQHPRPIADQLLARVDLDALASGVRWVLCSGLLRFAVAWRPEIEGPT